MTAFIFAHAISIGLSMIDNAPSSATAATTPRHAGPHTALVKKHQSPRIDTLYPATKADTRSLDVFTLLLAWSEALFFIVKPALLSSRCTVEMLTGNRRRRFSSAKVRLVLNQAEAWYTDFDKNEKTRKLPAFSCVY